MKVPEPGHFFRASGGVLYKRSASSLEENFGGKIGRCIRAVRYGGSDEIGPQDLDWIPLAAVKQIYGDDEDAVVRTWERRMVQLSTRASRQRAAGAQPQKEVSMTDEQNEGQGEKLPEGDVPSPIPGGGDPGDETTKEGTGSAGA